MNAKSPMSFLFLPLAAVIWTAAGGVLAQEAEPDEGAGDVARTSSLRPSDGYLVDWAIIGPFPAPKEKGADFAVIDVHAATSVDSVRHAGSDYYWTSVITKNGGATVDLSREFGPDAQGIAYAATEVYVNRDMDATIRIETKEETACWINGKAVTLPSAGKRDKRAYRSSIRLRFGYNNIVIGLRHGRGTWRFSARVLDEAGKPIDPKRLRILDDGRTRQETPTLNAPRIRSLPEIVRP